MDNRVKRLLAVTITVVIGQAMPVQAQSEHKPAEPANVRVTAAPSAPTSPWQPPDLSGYASTLKPDHSTELVAGRPYTLPELIDIAERRNPATRVAWERASAAAAALGLVKSEYYPVLAMGAGAGIESTIVPLPQIVLSQGSFRLNFAASNPELVLRWLLVDFGRRSASDLGLRSHPVPGLAEQPFHHGIPMVEGDADWPASRPAHHRTRPAKS